jgi:hypothetical protein
VPAVDHYFDERSRAKATIDDPPINYQLQEANVEVTGTANSIPSDKRLWLVLYGPYAPRYWPIQSIQPNKKWRVEKERVRLAERGFYTLILYLATGSQSSVLQQYIESPAGAAGKGMPAVPEMERLDYRDVTRIM